MMDREVPVSGTAESRTLRRLERQERLPRKSGARFCYGCARQPGRDDLIVDENRLDGTTFSAFPAGIFEIIGNVVLNLRDGRIPLHFENFRTDFDACLTSDAQFFIHPYSHGFPLDGV